MFLKFSKTIFIFQLLNPGFSLNRNHHLIGSFSVYSHSPVHWIYIHPALLCNPAGKPEPWVQKDSSLTAGIKTNRNVAVLVHELYSLYIYALEMYIHKCTILQPNLRILRNPVSLVPPLWKPFKAVSTSVALSLEVLELLRDFFQDVDTLKVFLILYLS